MKTRNQLSGIASRNATASKDTTNCSSPTSLGPTRNLPRRSCGRPNSLLATNQPAKSAICNETKLSPSNKIDCKPPPGETTSSKDDTNCTSLLLPPQSGTTSTATIRGENMSVARIDNSGQAHSQSSSSSSNGKGREKKIFNILIGVTGSVATIKLIELTKKIKSMFPRPYTSELNGATPEATVQIKIVMTKNSTHFAPKDELIKNLDDPLIEIYDDSDEWSRWKKIGDPVLHIELRKWADLCLIAPLDANTMAKLANGLCDNLLTCVVRAWDISKPLVYCPAMNVHMYNHPMTREHLSKLQSFGYQRVDCVEKRLACGDFGLGGMAPVEVIFNKVLECLIQPVNRRVSSASLLNRQPTYPIISIPGDHASVGQNQSDISTSSSILKRFRANNQITIHPVPNNSCRATNQNYTQIDAGSFIEQQHQQPQQRYKPNWFDGNPGERHDGDRFRGRTYSTYSKRNTGGVTSVQNLKAIGLDDDSYTISQRLIMDEDDGEMEIGDFDPSGLLEQSMTTDDSTMIFNNERISNHYAATSAPVLIRNPPVTLSRNSHLGEGGSVGGSHNAPSFNASKILASCYIKERGCFTCTICKHDYKNRKSMARHLKEQHLQGNIFHCKPCGVSYKRREKLIKHNKERHPDIEMPCMKSLDRCR